MIYTNSKYKNLKSEIESLKEDLNFFQKICMENNNKINTILHFILHDYSEQRSEIYQRICECEGVSNKNSVDIKFLQASCEAHSELLKKQ